MNLKFRRIRRIMNRLQAEAETMQPVDIHYWQKKIFNVGVSIGLILGFIFLVASFTLAFQNGNFKLAISSLAGYVFLFGLYFIKLKKLEYKFVLLIIISLIYGIYLIYFTHHTSTGLLFIFVSSIMTGVFRNLKETYISLFINSSVLFIAGVLAFGFNYTGNTIYENYTLSSWIISSAEIIILNTIMAISLSILINGLEKSIKGENTVKKLLEIEHSRMLKAKDKAEEADRLKSAFLANMSHEIRTPMNGILGFAEYLKQHDIKDSEYKNFLGIIVDNGKYLLHLINDIIDISKIEANQLKIKEIQFSPDDLLDELFTFYHNHKNRIGKEHLSFYLLKTPNIQNVRMIGDRVRIKQVLSNLIDNAIKFTENGKVEFGFNIREDQTFEFFVEDTGIGLTNDEQHIIFDRFTQAKDPLNKPMKGTGLGLSISKSLVEMMGGTISVTSQKGSGSLFEIWIPKKAFYDTDNVLTELYLNRNSYFWTNKSILLVEDNPDGLQYLLTILQPTGVTLNYVTNGKDAVDYISKNRDVSLILMDIQLPKMNGLDATREILRINGHIPIIAQTAFSLAEDRERCIEAGCVDYVTKPIDRNHLLQTIQKYID